MNQSFSHEEAEQILTRAVRHDATGSRDSKTALSHEELVRMAAELGISAEAVATAEEEWRRTRADQVRALDEAEELRAFERHRRADWVSHATSYLTVNAFLAAINWFTSPGYWWFVWSVLGWGIGLAIHTASVMVHAGDDYDQEFDKWRAKRRKRLEQ